MQNDGIAVDDDPKKGTAHSIMPLPGITRRDVVVGSTASFGVWIAGPTAIPQAMAADAPPTAVLVNEQALRKKFPHDAGPLLDSIRKFTQRQNGEIVQVDGAQSAADIKARLKRLSRRPKRLVIFGDESCIPRFAVKVPGVDVQVDLFYGDLDGDGLSEVVIARVLGSPRAMANQIGELPKESYRGRVITYRGPKFVGEVREIRAGEWLANNEEGSNRYRSVTETSSEIILQHLGNAIQAKLDLAARKTFWRRGTQEAWQDGYDIVEFLGNDNFQATGLYKRIVYRRREGAMTDFGTVRRVGGDRWIGINRDVTNKYQQLAEPARSSFFPTLVIIPKSSLT